MVWKNSDGVADAMERGVVFHSHIPKTAGTSLLRSVKEALAPGHFIHWNPSNPYNIDRSLEELRKVLDENPSVKVVHGHFMYGMHRALDGRPFKYISVLRDPVARIFSHYKHAIELNLPSMGTEKAGLLVDTPIEHALRQPDISYFYNNIQARFISGLSEPDFGGRSDAEVLDLCKEHVRNDYCYLGAQTSVLQAVTDLSELLGGIPMQERVENARGRMDARLLFSAEQLESVESQNKLDISLLKTFCPDIELSSAVTAADAENNMSKVMLDTYRKATKKLIKRVAKAEKKTAGGR
ncbi:sulfotransferase family 2 domain-containing protein [Roseivivax sediminis]|uniref:Sulfotransferase family protein n=1 Tax=Roseivivax sediminis TaxID=936889 RepID=A0A1I2CVT2_9RHOB|nr:sulfotransferase family 2 domain-containing protein [Roseivivax sediminis]SFE71810.1 Sulfotransferase family protein [Roseivivax sediminis]